MTDFQSLQITADTSGGALTPSQERFNALVRDVAAWRATLAEWQQRMERCDRTLAPIRHQVIVALRQWVLALDAASLHPTLSRAERAELGELIRDAATELLGAGEGDAEIASLLQQHGGDITVASADANEASHADAASPPPPGEAAHASADGEPESDPDAWQRVGVAFGFSFGGRVRCFSWRRW